MFDAAAGRLDTLPSYAEKDFWVCFVLDALYNRLPDRHPRLTFRGGTSLSKGLVSLNGFPKISISSFTVMTWASMGSATRPSPLPYRTTNGTLSPRN